MVCRWHDSLLGALKDSNKRLLDFREFGRVAEYKINEHESMALVCTTNSMSENELVSAVPFKIVEMSSKYIGINLTKKRKTSIRKIGKC